MFDLRELLQIPTAEANGIQGGPISNHAAAPLAPSTSSSSSSGLTATKPLAPRLPAAQRSGPPSFLRPFPKPDEVSTAATSRPAEGAAEPSRLRTGRVKELRNKLTPIARVAAAPAPVSAAAAGKKSAPPRLERALSTPLSARSQLASTAIRPSPRLPSSATAPTISNVRMSSLPIAPRVQRAPESTVRPAQLSRTPPQVAAATTLRASATPEQSRRPAVSRSADNLPPHDGYCRRCRATLTDADRVERPRVLQAPREPVASRRPEQVRERGPGRSNERRVDRRNNSDEISDNGEDNYGFEARRPRNSPKRSGMIDDRRLADESFVKQNMSSIISNLVGGGRRRRRERREFTSDSECDSDSMEASFESTILEEKQSARMAKLEDRREEMRDLRRREMRRKLLKSSKSSEM